jgi:hypothetical protein
MHCVFCGYPKTTNEHVFPQWLLKDIPGRGDNILHRSEAPAGSGAETREWSTPVLSFKAKVVCGQHCNGGWMSRLERDARPFLVSMIRGNGRSYYDHGRELIAYWALKTAMMIDFAQEPDLRCVPLSDYPALYQAQAVLPNTFVWLAKCDSGAGARAQNRTIRFPFGDREVDGYGGTVNVGHLVLSVLRADFGGGRGIDIRGELGDALDRVWPATGPVAWPPRRTLTREGVERLGEMIGASRTTIS